MRYDPAMFATAIGGFTSAATAPSPPGYPCFHDCDYAGWYGPYVDWCSETGVIKGVGTVSSSPTGRSPGRRWPRFYTLRRSLKIRPGETGTGPSFLDASEIASWAREAAGTANRPACFRGAAGLCSGDSATRAEGGNHIQRLIRLSLN
jgi:hypothetical protein